MSQHGLDDSVRLRETGPAALTGLRGLFLDHPAAVDESYAEHLRFAARFGGMMVLGGLACLVHAVFPFLFTSTASRTVRHLHGVLAACSPRSGTPATVMSEPRGN